jgi:hypothetical protein
MNKNVSDKKRFGRIVGRSAKEVQRESWWHFDHYSCINIDWCLTALAV